ncbi:copper resistance protein NlpE [Chryseobacterium potabilaquae]|uniref:Copper resistance protein NlpE n=1 Tax=Chryseobacterium potabilaquae TaxID=2675057 RepID=A0A6N4X1K1_9FLAO|nr:copper resistance protein NlpE [Chryseobacterium potabilaquae]CAA7194708.1 hypothetical protein CHRY9293_01000 [Chryseobacterium potabilaquae]
MNQSCVLGFLAVAFLFSCSPKTKPQVVNLNQKTDSTSMYSSIDNLAINVSEHNSQNSLDWEGTYEAVIPCADCAGIKTIITLYKNKTFSISEEYLEKKFNNKDRGIFQWDSTGNMITLKGNTVNYIYKVGENKMVLLDTNGHSIDGPNKDLYILNKK